MTRDETRIQIHETAVAALDELLELGRWRKECKLGHGTTENAIASVEIHLRKIAELTDELA